MLDSPNLFESKLDITLKRLYLVKDILNVQNVPVIKSGDQDQNF